MCRQALLKALDEDELDPEERVRRCQADARQFLQVKPDMAWSRAQQAITLLGRPGSLASVSDEAARTAAYLTLGEACFILGLGNTRPAPELGRPDLFSKAYRANPLVQNWRTAQNPASDRVRLVCSARATVSCSCGMALRTLLRQIRDDQIDT